MSGFSLRLLLFLLCFSSFASEFSKFGRYQHNDIGIRIIFFTPLDGHQVSITRWHLLLTHRTKIMGSKNSGRGQWQSRRLSRWGMKHWNKNPQWNQNSTRMHIMAISEFTAAFATAIEMTAAAETLLLSEWGKSSSGSHKISVNAMSAGNAELDRTLWQRCPFPSLFMTMSELSYPNAPDGKMHKMHQIMDRRLSSRHSRMQSFMYHLKRKLENWEISMRWETEIQT